MSIYCFNSISQIRKMVPNSGSGTLYRDQLPRLSLGFTLLFCLVCSPKTTPLSFTQRYQEVLVKKKMLSPCLCTWLPPFRSLRPHTVFKISSLRGEIQRAAQTIISSQLCSKTETCPRVIERQGVEPGQEIRLKGR